MAKYICEFIGVRGRKMRLYDTKVEINTEVTIGSVLTSNATDGTKTIFLKDVVGVQFKNSGLAIGYLQFETPSMQMNNKNSNFFSENTFTFEEGKNGLTNDIMYLLYKYICERVEELKYETEVVEQIPDFNSLINRNLTPNQPYYPNGQYAQAPQGAPVPPQGVPYYGYAQAPVPPQAPPPDLGTVKSVNGNGDWICEDCGSTNISSAKYCRSCGSAKK